MKRGTRGQPDTRSGVVRTRDMVLSRCRGVLMIALMSGLLFALTGCTKPLFPSYTNRTQFDDADRLRGQYVPAKETDVFGRNQPNLRARLNRY